MARQSRNLIIFTPVIKDQYRGLARHFHEENAGEVCNERKQFVRAENPIYHNFSNGLPPKNGAFHWHTPTTQCAIGKNKSLVWCRWSADFCVKQIDICVILRAFSQNCKCVSIGVVTSIGEYGLLSGLVSARSGGGDSESHLLWPPTVSDSLPALCGSASFSVVLKFIQMDLWEAEYNRLLYEFCVLSFCANNCFVPL